MTKDYFMGIDIGTYSTKGVITDELGTILCSKVIAHDIITPRQGYVEHDPRATWWDEVCMISHTLIKDGKLNSEDIKGVGISGIGPCCLPVDKDCQPLRNAILYGVDTRAVQEITWLNEKIGEDIIFERCANALSAQAVGPKILWIKNNEPEIYKKAHMYLTSTSFIVAKLTGKYVIDHYTASTFSPLYNYQTKSWDTQLCQDIVEVEKLPEVKWTTEIAGEIHAQAATETGLALGTAVIVGTADAAAEAISVGVTQPKEMMLMYGTTHFMIGVTDKPIVDHRIWAGPYLFQDTYAVMGGLATSGALTVWFKENFAKELVEKEQMGGENAFAFLAKEVSHVPVGSNGIIVLPYFSGARTPINNPNAKGVIFGLNIMHKREEVYRALLEGVGYAIHQNIEIFDEVGLDIQNIYSVGGGTNNTSWMQIISDCCSREQWVSRHKIGASYGDAFLAALGKGVVKNRTAIKSWNSIQKKIIPRTVNTQKYKSLMKKYLALYCATKKLMD